MANMWEEPRRAGRKSVFRRARASSYHKYMGLSDSPLAIWAAGLVSGHGGPLPPNLFADSDLSRGLGLYPSSLKLGIFKFIIGVFVYFLRFGGIVALCTLSGLRKAKSRTFLSM